MFAQPAQQAQSDSVKLFFAFIQDYLEIEFQGTQKGFSFGAKTIPNQILFRGPNGSTLCVPWDIMLLNTRAEARAVIQAKIVDSLNQFLKAAH